MINKALEYCKEKHKNQKRKYTSEPYVVHPIEVMNIVKAVKHTESMLIAALLHDTVEDTDATLEEIEQLFGKEVSTLVEMLTDVSTKTDGNRKQRKLIDRNHTEKANPYAKTIKLADLISNTKSITKHDPSFAKVYMAEKRLLMQVLKEGDATLYAEAESLLNDFYK